MKGIYKLTIGNKCYIGKDTRIHNNARYKSHLDLLTKNIHYNSYLQKAYNKYKKVHYEILFTSKDISNKELSELEVKYIKKFNSYNEGYNLTLGGEGGNGLIISDEEKQRRSQRVSCDKNPQSRIKIDEFHKIMKLIILGYSNTEISNLMNKKYPPGYVSGLRYKKRLIYWIDKYYPDYKPAKHIKVGGKLIDYSLFLAIIDEIQKNELSFYDIDRKYDLEEATTSRIKRKKCCNYWWKIYNSDKGSTTIESK